LAAASIFGKKPDKKKAVQDCVGMAGSLKVRKLYEWKSERYE
jgi:hypothetical protein